MADNSADAPIDLRLLPCSAAVDGDGRLSIGGCDLAGLGQTSPVLQHRLSCRRLAIVALDNSTGLGRGAKSRCVRAARGSDNVSLHKAPEVA